MLSKYLENDTQQISPPHNQAFQNWKQRHIPFTAATKATQNWKCVSRESYKLGTRIAALWFYWSRETRFLQMEVPHHWLRRDIVREAPPTPCGSGRKWIGKDIWRSKLSFWGCPGRDTMGTSVPGMSELFLSKQCDCGIGIGGPVSKEEQNWETIKK